MFDELVTAYGNRFLVAALGVSLALLCLFIVLWLLRNRAPSPFVRGGRNRQPRLQVLDAAAVDARRRLVLVRRDNVEHLVMIGGLTDIVIESGIGDDRAYLSATPVTEAALQVAGELPASRQTEPAPAPRAIERVETPLATAAKAEVVPMTRPEVPVAVRPAPPAPAEMPAPMAAASVAKVAAPAVPPAPTQTPQPRPEPRMEAPRLEVPKVEAATSPSPRSEPAAPPRDTIEIVKLEGVRAEPPVLRPVSDLAAQPSSVAPARPEAAPFLPAGQPAPVSQAAAAPAPAATPAPAVEPELRPVDASARLAAPAAATAAMAAAPIIAATPDYAEPAAEPAANPHGDAADILEAARQRVLSPVSAPPRSEARPDQQSAAPEAPARSAELSEFERVLEEEMALHLAANDAQPVAPAPLPPLLPETRADRPVVPPMATPVRVDPVRTGTATPEEPDLQNEIARIFGEMSADRN
ncbi:MAG: flagellar biosynthetic protein FliO [Rhizobium sp.]|nr:flagellar biosynthetic protein FliO [Rhizobium sp.]